MEATGKPVVKVRFRTTESGTKIKPSLKIGNPKKKKKALKDYREIPNTGCTEHSRPGCFPPVEIAPSFLSKSL